jgi:hypothetical protein
MVQYEGTKPTTLQYGDLIVTWILKRAVQSRQTEFHFSSHDQARVQCVSPLLEIT